MTTFSDIYNNALGYRNDLYQLQQLTIKLSKEKEKGEPLITWFRLRNRRVAQILEPMEQELKNRVKEKKKRIALISKSSFSLKRAKNLIQNEQFWQAEKIINEILESIFDDSIKLEKEVDHSIAQIDTLESRLKKEQVKETNDVNYCLSTEKNVKRVKELFSSTRTAKDVDVTEFNEAIKSINNQIKTLNIDVPMLKEVPETYDKNTIASLHEEIRSIVKTIDSRYTMKLFSKAIRTIRIVIHDVGNDRGKRAFYNRSNELLANANEAIEMFNTKYWQITGQRWERTGRNEWGYKTVSPTHPKINDI